MNRAHLHPSFKALCIRTVDIGINENTDISRLSYQIAECEAAGVSVEITQLKGADMDKINCFMDGLLDAKGVLRRVQKVIFISQDEDFLIEGGGLAQLTECCPNITGGSLICVFSMEYEIRANATCIFFT